MTRFELRGFVIRNIFSFVVCALTCACVLAPAAWAQHVGGHMGGAPHMSAPPVSHAPISHAPIAHAPIARGPVLGPRFSVAPPVGRFGNGFLRYRGGPIRPLPPVYPYFPYGYPFWFGGPFYGFWPGWGFSACAWGDCDLLWNWGLSYNTFPFYGYGAGNYISAPSYSYGYEAPAYGYGQERPDLPQLWLKDGQVLNVTDYWLVDEELHYAMREGGKNVEHVIAFDELDLPRTIDVAKQRGFVFVLRDEPAESYMEHHPEIQP